MSKNHEEVKNLLDRVPGVSEHMNKLSVQKGKTILKRRVDLGLTQIDMVEKLSEMGFNISKQTLSMTEGGHEEVVSFVYDNISAVLDELERRE
ncbi:hypothetical protein [Alkalibacillus haloalkaliphilus]|uniref:hypothetical protein n=1 Tax=Alkalibacillus haloalkaliphilus TaxID=94136 RepID=UPI0002EED9F3|nr:hypothetical protein [Alkalibacillus haloalkaliphilus]